MSGAKEAIDSKARSAFDIFVSERFPIDQRLKQAEVLCEIFEAFPSDEGVKKLVPTVYESLNKLLVETDGQFIRENLLNRLRQMSVEVIHKMRNTEFCKTHVSDILQTLFKIIERENEETAILTVKVIIDLHKLHRPHFAPEVLQFLEFIRRIYRNLKTHVCNIFKPDDVYEVNSLQDLETSPLPFEAFSVITVMTKEGGSSSVYHLIPKACLSLKVMQEIPILIVLFYQLYKPQILDSLVEFIPLIMEFINMRPLPEHTCAQSSRESRYLDFMAAQVKTLSFLAYIIKYHQPCIESHSSAMVKGIMNLMITCPSSVTNLRKEFFIATRHILNYQEVRPKFLQVIDDMMDDNILVGEGFTVRESLRPLSYSMLADLLHHLRNDLSLTRVARAIDLYGKNIFDDTLPFSIQHLSQRIILNLADCIRNRILEMDSSKPSLKVGSARRLFFQILFICTQKCRIFAEHCIPELEAMCIREDSDISEPKCSEEEFDIETSSKQTASPFFETFNQGQLSINDMRSAIKMLVTGLRAVVNALTICPHATDSEEDAIHRNDSPVSASTVPSNNLTPAEVTVLSDYLTYGLRVLDIFRIVSKDGVLYIRGINSGVKYPEERVLLENLANTFVPLSATSFREIFLPKIGYIVDWCRKSPLFYAHFAYHLLSQTAQTSTFGRILLSYLVERLDKIGEGNDVSFTYMRLLKFCFNSVNMPGTDNEQVMKMHLRKIVQGSMQCCLEAREPISYLSLLRALFRSIGGGAHDRLYKEFFPLLPEMLTMLNRLLRSAHRTHARDLLGELCVIVPVRLSTLLPYLSLLMEPLTYVINCNTVNQGLRTLELCVDNMQPDFLYQHLYQVRGDMLLGLYTSLHSQSEYVQKMAFKVLGKLGRFNRADISDVQRLNLSVDCGESGPLLRFWLHEFPQHPVDLPIRSLVDFSVEIIQAWEPTVDYQCRIRAWQFLRGVCISALSIYTCSRNATGYLTNEFLDHFIPYPLSKLCEVVHKLDSIPVTFLGDKPSIYHLVMVRVIGGIFLSTTVMPSIPTSGSFMTFLVRHLTLLGLLEERKVAQPVALPDPIASDTRLPLDSRVLIEAICFIMGYEDKALVRTGYTIMDEVINTASIAIEAALTQDGSCQASAKDILPRLPIMQYFAKAITDMLYHPAWYVKWGGCCTLLYLRDRISVIWFREHLVIFLRGMLHCLHDLTNQMGQGALALAQKCSRSLVEFVFSNEASLYSQLSRQKSGITKEEPSSLQHSGKRISATRRRPVSISKRGGTPKKKITGRCKELESPTHDSPEDMDIPEISSSLPSDVISQTPLMNAVLHELVESLLSETKVVRAQVRALLSVIAECLSMPLSSLLKPHIHLIDGWLPPKNRNQRLSCLPISTQIAVLETNYFLCREAPHGAGLLHYSPTNRRCDNRFLADMRAIMDAPLPTTVDISSQNTPLRALAPPQNIFSSLQLQMAIDLKVVAAQVLSTMHYLDAQKPTILGALFKGICSEDATIHRSVFESTKAFVEHTTIDTELRNTYVRPILPNFRQTSNLRLASIRQLTCCAELFPSTFSERFCETIDSILTNFVNKSNTEAPPQTLEMISALMELFSLLPLAKEKYVHCLLSMVIKVEKKLFIEQTSPLRLPLVRFLVRYPKETFEDVLNGFPRPDDIRAHRIFLHLVTLPEGKPLVDYLIENISLLIDLLCPQDKEHVTVYETTPLSLPKCNGPLTRASTFHLALRLVHMLFKQRPEWYLSTLPTASQSVLMCSADEFPLLRVLLDLWDSASFWRRHSFITLVKLQELQPHAALSLLLEDTGDEGKRIVQSASTSMTSTSQNETMENLTMSRVRIYEGLTDMFHVVEPVILLEMLLCCAETRPNDFDLIFRIVAGMSRYHCVGHNPLSRFIQRLAREAPVAWCRSIFLHFVVLMNRRIEILPTGVSGSNKKKQSMNESFSTGHSILTSVKQYIETSEAQVKLMAHLIVPCLYHALQKDPAGLVALGLPPKPEEPNSDDLVHVLVDLLARDKDIKKNTGLRIMYYQIASLFVYYAPEYVHDASSSLKSYRLQEITSHVEHCITSNMNVVDLQEKYTGLQVLVNTVVRFYPVMGHLSNDIFLALAKGPQTEVKKMVNPTIDLLLPVWVTGPDEQKELAYSLKRAMQEDQSVQSIIHLLGMVVRHSTLFAPVRHILISPLLININRLTTQQLPIDQRRLILDLIEVVVRWDIRCKAEDREQQRDQESTSSGVKQSQSSTTGRDFMVIEKPVRDQLCNFLIRYACQAIEPTSNGLSSEASARRALSLVETVLATDAWGGPTCDLRLGFIDRLICLDDAPLVQGTSSQQQAQQQQTILPSIFFMTIEVLRVLYSTLDSPTLLVNVKHFNRILLNLLSRHQTNFRLMRASAGLIKALLTKYPAEPANRQKLTNYLELVELYEFVIKFIQEAIIAYFESSSRSSALISRLQSAFCLLTTTQQAPTNPYAFVDRCLTHLVKLFHRLVIEVVGQTTTNSSQDSATLNHLTEMLIQTLEILKSRLNVLNADVRKNSFGPDYTVILERSRDAKLFRAAVRVLRDWVNMPKAEEHFAPATREKVTFLLRLWNAYPRWSEHPEVVREILDCIYQIYINVSNKSYELFSKMSQAFCCAMLSPLPDIREKFLNRFLLGSDITSMDFLDDNDEAQTSTPTPTAAKNDLFIRLLFLLDSCQWDDTYYKDGFWLPIFFDVLLCDADFNRPAVIAQTEGRFASFPVEKELKPSSASVTLKITDLFDTSNLKPSDSPEASKQGDPVTQRSRDAFELLMSQQTVTLNAIKKISFKATLRGFLSLVHLRPAIASQLFGQLWHCLWHRFLVRESCNRLPYPMASEHPDVAASPADPSLVPVFVATINGNSDARNASERRSDLVRFVNQFITSDAHVSTTEGVPSAIGSTVASFGTTADYLLAALPTGVLMYVASDFNQWYNVILLLESLCARAQRALANNTYNSQIDYDLSMAATSKADGSVEDVPLGTASLALLSIYDRIGEEDYPVAAWWHRLSSPCTHSQRVKGLARGQILRFPLDRTPDLLIALTAISQGQYMRGIDIITNVLSRHPSGESTTLPPPSSSPEPTSLLQSGDLLNKSRMYDYTLRVMKQLGNWEAMESLASTITGSSGSEPLGGSPLLTTLRCEIAWRNRDWPDLLATLPIVSNEAPLHEQWRLALISAAGSVLGLRATGISEDVGSDGGSGGGGNGGTTPSVAIGGSGGGGGASANTPSSAGGSSAFSTNLLQSIEAENTSIMSTILREWRRLPLIVTNQHVRLLQACQQASEIHDGNFLLVQHAVPSLNAGANQALTPGVSPSRIPMSQSMYDPKSIFRSWQSRGPLISDDLSFWNDLLTWRQIVVESLINSGAYSHKYTQDRRTFRLQNSLVASCHRERAMAMLQIAKGFRKMGLLGKAQNVLNDYKSTGLAPLFEKTKQEIKIKLADTAKESRLEGCDLLEKTNIQQYDRKEKALFFAYKAVFFSSFNKGDDATRNFGYAIQMNDTIHQVWSLFGDFLEVVYTNNRTSKKNESNIWNTGVFAMQALMEAATVAGTVQRKSHADLARCIWLLTLDDAGDSSSSPSTTGGAVPSHSPTGAVNPSSGSSTGSQTQRFARTFEERASRVHPDAFLPWLPSLAVCLLRPEGRYISSALRGIALAYPTALSSVLRGLQHQLAIEMDRDRRIAAALTDLSPDQRRRLDEAYSHCVDLAREDARRRVGGSSSSGAGTVDHSQQSQQQHQSHMGLGGGSAKRTKKRVVVVMRGAEGEKLGEGAASSQSSTEGGARDAAATGVEGQEVDVDEEDPDLAPSAVVDDSPPTEFDDIGGVRTGYLSSSVGEGLHRVNLLFAQLRQRHPARLYVADRFVEFTAGRLLPSWSENLLHHLYKALHHLHQIAWAQVSRTVRRPSASLGPFQASIHNLSCPLPSWMAKELQDIVTYCGLPPPLAASSEDLLPEDSESRSCSALVFADNIQLAYTLLANEAESDPWFKPIKETLSSALNNIGSMKLLGAIILVSKELIPLVERRVNSLPHISYLSDRGAGNLIELISSLNVQSILSPYPRSFQNATTTPQASVVSAATLLELPGEATRLKFIPALHQSQRSQQQQQKEGTSHHQPVGVNPNPIIAANNAVANESNQPGLLYVADILPIVVRVPSAGGRRLALRANNGRVFHYDIPCLPREVPAGLGVSVMAADPTEAGSLAPTLAAYASWREAWCPPHLFHLINDVAARSHETAKRRVNLITPRTLDLGPHGMRLTQAGTSIPATYMVAANAVAFGNPTVTGFGSLLAQQLHPQASSSGSSQPAPLTDNLSPPLPVAHDGSYDLPRPDAFAHLRGAEKQPTQQPPLQQTSVVNDDPVFELSIDSFRVPGNSTGYAGSRGNALEVAGYPTSLDTGCHAACMSLAAIIDGEIGEGSSNTSSNSLTSRELVTAFFERLSTLATTTDPKSVNLKGALLKIFEELLQLVPQGANLKFPAPPSIPVISDEYSVPGSAVRVWAYRRMADAESFWLFRNGVSISCGAIAAMETLFSMSLLNASNLILEPRVGRAETRGLRFDLPATPNALSITHLQQRESTVTDLVSKSSTTLANFFSSYFAPLRPHTPLSAGRTAVAQPVSIPSRPATLRLTPQLAGLICIPGVPATIGPFAAAFTTLNQAVGQKLLKVVACLRTLLRDDFILWHRGRQAAVHASLLADLLAIENDEAIMATAGSPINVPDLSNDALMHLITLSLDGFKHRSKVLSAGDKAVSDIINAACSHENLACMDPTWLPWY
ncbi:hypothetical protein Aperf_G00000045134 [Anoplocephala perfoliata]